MPSLSVIIATHDDDRALRICLLSLAKQTDKDFEIIVAQDGTYPSIRDVIHDLQSLFPHPIKLAQQEDKGFRAAKSRNNGLRLISTPYVVFLDGDCFVLPDFIKTHKNLAQKGYFVSGKRSYVRPALTQRILTKRQLPQSQRLLWIMRALSGQCTRFAEFIPLPNGQWRYKKATDWEKVQTCNLAAWKSDIETVNGFDNRYNGHGLEDSDFVVRLIHAGIQRKCGDHASIVLHLDHPRQSHPKGSPNTPIFEDTLRMRSQRAEDGLH